MCWAVSPYDNVLRQELISPSLWFEEQINDAQKGKLAARGALLDAILKHLEQLHLAYCHVDGLPFTIMIGNENKAQIHSRFKTERLQTGFSSNVGNDKSSSCY